MLRYELDSPALSAAIAKSKFKDVARFGKLQNGHILLQDHGDKVWYRNIKIRRLPAATGTRHRRGRSRGHERPHTGTGSRVLRITANESAKRVDVTHRRQAVHLLHLARHAEEAGALSACAHRPARW